jgi:hypothetical protein
VAAAGGKRQHRGPPGFKGQHFVSVPSIVLLTRASQAQSFNEGISAVGYKNRLKWALYDLSTHSFRHPVAEGTPEWEGQAEGIGHPFSPFARPGTIELEYCRRLSEWWAKVKEKEDARDANTTVHQIGGTAGSYRREIPKRQHRLICDAGPEIEPNGFFDCTVEVSFGLHPDSLYYAHPRRALGFVWSCQRQRPLQSLRH